MQFSNPSLTDNPWGAALLAFVLLLPRFLLRLSYPCALVALGSRRLWAGYIVGTTAAVLSLVVAQLIGVRPWLEAVPIAGVELMSRLSPAYMYVAGGLVGWFMAALVSAPVSAWLNAMGRAHGVLLLALSAGMGLLAGLLACLAWPQPLYVMAFSAASGITLFFVISLGFALGAGLPMRVRIHPSNAN